MLTLVYLVMSVLLICVYPWVSSDVSVAHLCLPSSVVSSDVSVAHMWGIQGCQCCSSVLTLGYLVMSVLLIGVFPWVSSDVSVAQLCLPLGI